jgi:hypothetical protein
MFFARGFSCIPSTRMRVPAGIASRMFKEVAVHAKSINEKIRSIPIRRNRDSRTIGTKMVMSTRKARKKLCPRSSTQKGNSGASVCFCTFSSGDPKVCFLTVTGSDIQLVSFSFARGMIAPAIDIRDFLHRSALDAAILTARQAGHVHDGCAIGLFLLLPWNPPRLTYGCPLSIWKRCHS